MPLPPNITPLDFPYYWWKEYFQRHPRVEPYRYWDTPDYEDTHKKVYIAAKWGLSTAVIWSFFDVLAINRDMSYIKSVGRIFSNVGRIGGTFVLGSTMVHTVANFRQKDDYVNWMIGCGSSGIIWGYKYKSFAIGAGVSAAFAAVGWIIKRAETEQWGIIPARDIDDTSLQNGAYGGRRYADWTINAIKPKRRYDPGDRCRYID